MIFIDILYFLLPIAVAIAVVAFFAGSLFYMFSGDKAVHKARGEYLMSLAIVMTILVLIVLLLSTIA